MKNQSTNKKPQATCSGDVTGGSTVRGKAWGFLFLRRYAMAKELKSNFVDFEASMDRIEAAANILTKFSADDFEDGSAVFFDVGEIIKKECADLRENNERG